MGWSNDQAQIVLGLALVYQNSSLLLSNNSTLVVDDTSSIVVAGRVLTNSYECGNALADPDVSNSVNYTTVGTIIVPFTKHRDDTLVTFRVHCSLSVSNATAVIRYGARINGLDYDVAQRPVPGANVPMEISGEAFFSGIPAGTYNVQIVWKRVSGIGVLTQTTDDMNNLVVMEVA